MEDDEAFTYDPIRKVFICRTEDGKEHIIRTSPKAMNSLVRATAQVMMTEEILPTVQLQQEQQRHGKKTTSMDIVLYNPEEDPLLAPNTLTANFVDELISQSPENRKYSSEKKATVAHGIFKLANGNFSSIQQLHVTNQLQMDRTSVRSIDTLGKYGIASSRKSIQKILYVDDGSDEHMKFRLEAESQYGKKIVGLLFDNLQWATGQGSYTHTVTAAAIILDLEAINNAYGEICQDSRYLRILGTGRAESLAVSPHTGSTPTMDVSPSTGNAICRSESCSMNEVPCGSIFNEMSFSSSSSSFRQNVNDGPSLLDSELMDVDSMPVPSSAETNGNSSSSSSSESADSPFDLLDRNFPPLEQFARVMPLLQPEDSETMYQMLANQLICRFGSICHVMVDIPDIFGARVTSFSACKTKKKQSKASKVDMQATEDSDDEIVFDDIESDEVQSNLPSKENTTEEKASLRLLRHKQTVFDLQYGDLKMIKPLAENFSTLSGTMAHPLAIIKAYSIGDRNPPPEFEFKENMRLLMLSGDGAPFKVQINTSFSPDSKLHPKLLHFKANLHAIFPILGSFHVEVKFAKGVNGFYAPFVKDLLTRMGRKTEGQQNYTLGFGRFDDSFEHIWCIQDAICVAAVKTYIKWKHKTQIASSTTSGNNECFGFANWLSQCNSKGRTALMYMIHLEPFYLLHYAIRDKQFEVYIAALLLTIEFDLATGDIEYGVMKAYQILRVMMLSEYWREILAHYFFATNLNEKGVQLDLLCEYIHKNVKWRVPKLRKEAYFMRALSQVELSLPETVRAMAQQNTPSNFVPTSVKPLNPHVVLQQKEVHLDRVLSLAENLEQSGLFELEVPLTHASLTVERSCSSTKLEDPKAVFSSLDGKDTFTGKIGILFSSGSHMGATVFQDFSAHVVQGMEESRLLWNQLLDGSLSPYDEEEEDDEEVHEECNDNACDEIRSSGVGKAAEKNLPDMSPIQRGNGEEEDTNDGNNKRTKQRRMKTFPSWKPVDTHALIVTNLHGGSKRLAKLDATVLRLLSVPRTNANFMVDLDALLQSRATTIGMLVALLKYSYSIFLCMYLDDTSKIAEVYETDHIQSYMILLASKGASSSEIEVFRTIEKVLSLKTLPKKCVLGQAYKDLRLNLTPELDQYITNAARTALEEAEKCIDVGDIGVCWEPWANRIKRGGLDMHTMEGEGEGSMQNSIHTLMHMYETHLEMISNTHVETLQNKFDDFTIGRNKQT